jgi:FR47-like protein
LNLTGSGDLNNTGTVAIAQAVVKLGAPNCFVRWEPVTFQEFAALHMPALEADEIRFNLMISVMAGAVKAFPEGFHYWELGEAGHCAVQSPGRSIVLGDLDCGECQLLARQTKEHSYGGVIGSGDTAHWFADEAHALGITFQEKEPQRIHVLCEPPRHPGSEGAPRAATPADTDLLCGWIQEFMREAVPHDPVPARVKVEEGIAAGKYLLWTVGGEPVSVAVIGRVLKSAMSIGPVYTPPGMRGRGYAGSATAALSERIFAEGKSAACLYTDLRNPYSNRCYEKVGFKPHCDAWHYIR